MCSFLAARPRKPPSCPGLSRGSTSWNHKTSIAGPRPSVPRVASARGVQITSRLPVLEVDPRIDPGIGEVGYEVHHQAEQREDVERREDDGVVAVDDRLEGEKPEAVEREDRFDEAPAEERADERTGKSRDHDEHRVAENMAVEPVVPTGPSCAR